LGNNGRYENWLRHFGKSTLDEDLIAEYRAAGYAQAPVIERDDADQSVSVGHLTVVGREPATFGRSKEFGDGVSIFSGITIHLQRGDQTGYTDPLPFGLKADFTRTEVRQRLGEPKESDEDDEWDVWTIDELEVIVGYVENSDEIESVSVYLPEEN